MLNYQRVYVYTNVHVHVTVCPAMLNVCTQTHAHSFRVLPEMYIHYDALRCNFTILPCLTLPPYLNNINSIPNKTIPHHSMTLHAYMCLCIYNYIYIVVLNLSFCPPVYLSISSNLIYYPPSQTMCVWKLGTTKSHRLLYHHFPYWPDIPVYPVIAHTHTPHFNHSWYKSMLLNYHQKE
jgi:hypothetical protein